MDSVEGYGLVELGNADVDAAVKYNYAEVTDYHTAPFFLMLEAKPGVTGQAVLNFLIQFTDEGVCDGGLRIDPTD